MQMQSISHWGMFETGWHDGDSIDQLGLSTRCRNVLKLAGINTIAELQQLLEPELTAWGRPSQRRVLRLPGAGVAYLKEMNEAMARFKDA